jgi:hypothetical protein
VVPARPSAPRKPPVRDLILGPLLVTIVAVAIDPVNRVTPTFPVKL